MPYPLRMESTIETSALITLHRAMPSYANKLAVRYVTSRLKRGSEFDYPSAAN